MKALVINQKQGTLSLNEVKEPEIKEPEQVLVKVRYVGICGTDVGMIGCKNPNGPICTLGHEVCGVVAAIGEGVHDLKVGDPVCVSTGTICGTCSYCKSGRENLCDNEGVSTFIGLSIDGGMADYILSKRRRVFLLPPHLPLKIAALTEPFACAFHPLELAARYLDPETSNTLVIGCGLTGMGMALLLHSRGFKNITVVQRSQPRRDALLGFKLGIRAVHPDVLMEEFKSKNGRKEGFDFIFDTAGTRKSIQEYFPLTRKGGQFCMFGIDTRDSTLCCDAIDPIDMIWNEISLFGSIAFTPEEFAKSIEAVDELHKSIDLSKVGIKLYPIEKYEEGFKDMENRNLTKVMFEFNA